MTDTHLKTHAQAIQDVIVRMIRLMGTDARNELRENIERLHSRPEKERKAGSGSAYEVCLDQILAATEEWNAGADE